MALLREVLAPVPHPEEDLLPPVGEGDAHGLEEVGEAAVAAAGTAEDTEEVTSLIRGRIDKGKKNTMRG